MMPLLLLPVMLLAARAALDSVDTSAKTFRQTDPVTGEQVECDRCRPGTYLRGRCTSTRRSECAPCPPGSFTELWNHIGKCLRCGVCGQNQVVKSACTADSDCQCECKPGFYFKTKYEMCVRHSECPPGQGVLSRGTPNEDTVCYTCPNDTYSAIASALQNCTAHVSCKALGLQLLLRGSTWHDSICISCADLSSRDGATYLKEILPPFFLHHKMSVKRLRRVVHNLPSEDGNKQARTLPRNLSDLNVELNTWVASATAEQIRQLPAILTKAGANGTRERLQNKLHRIDSNLKELCALREVDVV